LLIAWGGGQPARPEALPHVAEGQLALLMADIALQARDDRDLAAALAQELSMSSPPTRPAMRLSTPTWASWPDRGRSAC
jgi:hypothetical protein